MVTQVSDQPCSRTLDAAIKDYLDETARHKSHGTLAAYTTTLSLFRASCAKQRLVDKRPRYNETRAVRHASSNDAHQVGGNSL